MISKTFSRYVWLVNLFLKHPQQTYEEVSLHYEDDGLGEDGLPLRTFHQYRKGVEELFGIRIVCEPTNGYRYHAEGMELLRRDKARQWLVDTYGLATDITAAHNLRDRILLESIPKGMQQFDSVLQALRENRELQVDYQAHGGHLQTLRMQPYCLRIVSRRWYVLGHIQEKPELRHLALDRMVDCQVTNTCFELPKDFDAQRYYADSVGIYVDRQLTPQKVLLRIYGQQVDYLRDMPLHQSQEEVYTKYQDHSDFQYSVCLTPDLTTRILAMAENVEVLEPQELREEVKRKLTECLSRYPN